MSAPGVIAGVPRRLWLLAVTVGVAIAVVYGLSPLTVWFAVAAVALVAWAERGLAGFERRWVRTMLIIAISIRVLALLGLFLSTNHAQVPFATFFGDEELVIRRSIWLRSLALGLPVHGADLLYAFDDVGATSYLYVQALLQILFGQSPYGIHLLDMAIHLAATILLYRLVRATLGRMPALVGLTVMLFLPSLFAWSISALKEPAFLFLTVLELVAVVSIARARGWTRRVVAVLTIAAVLAVVEGLRRAGFAITAAGLAGGVALAWLVRRPAVLVGVLCLAPIAAGAALSRPSMLVTFNDAVTRAGWQQAGHINTPGYSYKTLDDRFYENNEFIGDMTPSETFRFFVRSIWAYVTVPLPWDIESRSALAYLPEQIVWYLLLLVLPVGLWFAMRRDPLVTSLLIAHALVAALLVAVTSGNVGTLVRHRGMALPYFVWISAVGLCRLATALAPAGRAAVPGPDVPLTARVEGTWP